MLHVQIVEAVGVPTCALVATVMTLFAWHGRRVDDHPHCRKCGFDLHMKPESTSRCAECGELLTSRRAVRRGRRVLRPRPFLAGLLVLLICGTDGGFHAYGQARAINWDRYKPLWWLERQAESRNPTLRVAALSELVYRVNARSLSRDHERGLVLKALSHQADTASAWMPAWGDLVEAVHKSGRLDTDLWDRYELGSLQLHLRPVTDAMRSCDPVDFRVTAGPNRVGSSFDDDDFAAVVFFNNAVDIDSVRRQAMEIFSSRVWSFERPPDEGEFTAWDWTSLYPSAFDIGQPLHLRNAATDLTTRPHHVEASYFLRMTRRSESRETCNLHSASRTVRLTCDFTFSPSPVVVVDPALRERVKQSVRVNGVRYVSQTSQVYLQQDWLMSFDIDFIDVPENLAFRVLGYILNEDNSNHFLGYLYVPKGQSRHVLFSNGYDKALEIVDRDRLVLQLMADPRASPVGTDRVWGDNLSFSHLPQLPTDPSPD